MRIRRLGNLAGILPCLLLVACGAEQAVPVPQAPATPAPVATPTVQATPLPAMVLGTIMWTSGIDPDSGAPLDNVELYTPTAPDIIAAIYIQNMPPGLVITASWTVNDQPFLHDVMTITSDRWYDETWIAFGFTRNGEDPYPLGQLAVTITTSDGILRESSIKIGFP